MKTVGELREKDSEDPNNPGNPLPLRGRGRSPKLRERKARVGVYRGYPETQPELLDFRGSHFAILHP